MAPPPPEIPTWTILPAADGGFRWATFTAGARPRRCPPPQPPDTSAPRLPSMSDLLIHAERELLEGSGSGGDGAPMFRTGSGRPVAVPEGSVRRAASVLGEKGRGGAIEVSRMGSGGDPMRHSGNGGGGGGGGGEKGDGGRGGPMFTTGSGRPVSVSASSVKKAASILRDADGGVARLEPANTEVNAGLGVGRCGDGGDVPMFQTGSGRSVTVRKSSIEKAAALLGGGGEFKLLHLGVNGDSDGSVPMFQTGSGKIVTACQSSIMRAVSVLEDGNGERGFKKTADTGSMLSGSLFKTGSGKTVGVSSAGLRNAAAMLGLKGTCNPSSIFSGETRDRHLTRSDFSHSNVSMATTKLDGRELGHNMSSTFLRNEHPTENPSVGIDFQIFRQADFQSSTCLLPPLKFQTASGRSLLVSRDSLQRARSVLGDSDFGTLQSERETENHKGVKDNGNSVLNNENPFVMKSGIAGHFTKPKMGLSSDREQSNCVPTKFTVEENNLAPDGIWQSNCKTPYAIKKAGQDPLIVDKEVINLTGERPPIKPLTDITNNCNANVSSQKHFVRRKKGLSRGASIPIFKKPRNSRFTTPLRSNSSVLQNHDHLIARDCSHRAKISTRYPSHFKRKSLTEYFGGPPCHHGLNISSEIRGMTPDKTEKYEFQNTGGSGSIGVDTFIQMLLQSGAPPNLTKEWVTNHYKWIVWKLACLERSYPAQASGKYLTPGNVLEELKYRCERELNYGHRSAVKKIVNGDASPASMVVLCVSDIISCYDPGICKLDQRSTSSEGVNRAIQSDGDGSNVSKIELTDGWYSLYAILDAALSRHLLSGKLFVGQKLRICGAGICGWSGPVSPLNASKTVSLLLHINGTYRACWADKLGFCKGAGLPLSFKCIKVNGGPVPKTLVGVTRIYPLIYKERFSNGSSIVRSERMETKALQLFIQRRSNIIEDIIAEQKDYIVSDNDSEGAKIFKILQSAAEPEVLMADMSPEQLSSFSAFLSKQEAMKQSCLEKKIEKAFDEAGLQRREVTPFMRVRVTGLTRKGPSRKHHRREGLITIWCPTEKHRVELVEGQIYSVHGLVPQAVASDIIYLQARGSNTIWQPVHCKKMFEPFFNPRKPVLLSKLGEVPLSSEFDIAAIVVYVGDVYAISHQKRQWVFVTDSSIKDGGSDLPHLLAINFCSSTGDDDLTPPVNRNLSGCAVGFYNIVKKPRDQSNHLWVSEATENSVYALYQSMPSNCHLKEAADAANQWAKISTATIQRFKDRVSYIVGDSRRQGC